MTLQNLFIRCYAYKTGDLWVAVCIDLSLAAQADSLGEVRAKLAGQINDYVRSALNEDREHADYLLNRKSPPIDRCIYHSLNILAKLHLFKERCFSAFSELAPLKAA